MDNIFQSPHTRKNILTGEQVLVSPHRTKRPWQGKLEKRASRILEEYDPECYLCPGNKRANDEVNTNYDSTFVFKNDYAALIPEVETDVYKKGWLEASGERGICKVICFSPNHSLTLSRMTVEEIEKVIRTWQFEFKELSEISFINNVQIFENKGEMMGCSNPHPHGQIWAQSTIPNEINKKTFNFSEHYKTRNTTLLVDYLEQELQENERVIYQNEHFVVLVPFWAVWPFETMIVPKMAMETMLGMDNSMITNYARAIKTITALYDNVFDVLFPYSSGIHQAPTNGESNLGWHWHMSFYPPLLRSATIKKFMVGYEMFAMPQRDITPEMAAERLKSIL